MICKITGGNNASDLQSQIERLDLVGALGDFECLTGSLLQGQFSPSENHIKFHLAQILTRG